MQAVDAVMLIWTYSQIKKQLVRHRLLRSGTVRFDRLRLDARVILVLQEFDQVHDVVKALTL